MIESIYEVDESIRGVVGIRWLAPLPGVESHHDFTQRVVGDARILQACDGTRPILLIGAGASDLVMWVVAALRDRFKVIALDVGHSSSALSTVIYSGIDRWPEAKLLKVGLTAAWKGCDPAEVASVVNEARDGWNGAWNPEWVAA